MLYNLNLSTFGTWSHSTPSNPKTVQISRSPQTTLAIINRYLAMSSLEASNPQVPYHLLPLFEPTPESIFFSISPSSAARHQPTHAYRGRAVHCSRSIRSRLFSPPSSKVDYDTVSAPGVITVEREAELVPSYERSTHRLFRRSSKSLPDISDDSEQSGKSQPSSAVSSLTKHSTKELEELLFSSTGLERTPKVKSSFSKVMRDITNDHDLMLSDVDMNLFLRLEGLESFKYDDCAAQLDSSGICVEAPIGTAMPKTPSNAWSFQYGPEQRKVVLVPEKLTALGFSVLSWIFTATEEYKPLFQILAMSVRFRNCLIQRLSRKIAKRGLKNKKVVVPMGLLYTLGVERSFVQEHGEHGDFAAYLGTLESTLPAQLSPSSIRRKNASVLPRLERETQVSNAGRPDGIMEEEVERNSGHPVKERLYLNEQNHLMFDRVSQRRQGVIGFKIGRNALGNREELQAAVASSDQDRPRSRAFAFEIVSFSDFLGLQMRQSSLVSRMKLLQVVLAKENVYPNGRNQGFLNLFMDSLPSAGTGEDIFIDPDCKAELKHLRQYGLKEHAFSGYIFIPNGSKGSGFYQVECRPIGLEQWEVRGPLNDVDINSCCDIFPALTRDLI